MEAGQLGLLLLNMDRGDVVTARDMSEVVQTLPLTNPVRISDAVAAGLGQAARALGWT
jgi:hypothetical protein